MSASLVMPVIDSVFNYNLIGTEFPVLSYIAKVELVFLFFASKKR